MDISDDFRRTLTRFLRPFFILVLFWISYFSNLCPFSHQFDTVWHHSTQNYENNSNLQFFASIVPLSMKFWSEKSNQIGKKLLPLANFMQGIIKKIEKFLYLSLVVEEQQLCSIIG